MTRLQVVNENFRPNNQHSVRVELTQECLADLEQMASKVLGPAELGVKELREAVEARDRDAAVAACHRLLAVGLVGRDIYQVIERQPA